MRRGLAVVVLAALLLGGAPASAREARAQEGAIGPDDGWEEILAAAARAAREGHYRGEAVSASWDSGAPSATLVEVEQRDGMLELRVLRTHGTASSGRGGPRLAEGVPLDGIAASVTRVPEPDRLTRKYEVSERGRADVLARRCAVLDIHDRADGALRERLWVDVDTGILLRRESYQGERLLRMAAFLSLESLGAGVTRQTGAGRQPAMEQKPSTDGASESAETSAHATAHPSLGSPPSAVLVEEAGLAALRAAGWRVPESLPGGFELEEVHAHGGGGMPPLQMVYGDGLYVLSLFAQRGSPDWDALPAGAEPARGVDFHAYEWPGRTPRRLVWSGAEETYTLIGDATPEEFRRIAESLPHASEDSGVGWMRRALRRIGQWWARLTG